MLRFDADDSKRIYLDRFLRAENRDIVTIIEAFFP
jgi:hypothetical protein